MRFVWRFRVRSVGESSWGFYENVEKNASLDSSIGSVSPTRLLEFDIIPCVGLVVIQKQVCVRFQICLQLCLQDLVVQPEKADEVVQVLVIHIEELVVRLQRQRKQMFK